MNKNCGAANCALPSVTQASSDIGLPFYRCPSCTALKIPDEQLLHASVEPDAQVKTPRIMGILFRMRELWLKQFVPELRQRQAAILDVGCGDGQWLEYLNRRGHARSYGYEVNAGRLRNALARGVKAFPDLASARTDQGTSFSIIFLWHVYEHLDTPVSILRTVLERLDRDGVLILSIPNHGGLATRRFGIFSGFLDYHRHLWYFGEPYFEWLGRTLPDFSVRRVPEANFEYEIYGWIDTVASVIVRRVNFVHLALKKGEGGPLKRLAAAALALVLAPLAVCLATATILLPRHSSTLTYAVRRRTD